MSAPSCTRVYADRNLIRNCRVKLDRHASTIARLSRVLNLAGNEVRLRILFLLKEEQQLCPCDLSDMLGISVPAVSQQMRKLKDAGVIDSKRVGQTIFYFLQPEHLALLKPFFSYIRTPENSKIKV